MMASQPSEGWNETCGHCGQGQGSSTTLACAGCASCMCFRLPGKEQLHSMLKVVVGPGWQDRVRSKFTFSTHRDASRSKAKALRAFHAEVCLQSHSEDTPAPQIRQELCEPMSQDEAWQKLGLSASTSLTKCHGHSVHSWFSFFQAPASIFSNSRIAESVKKFWLMAPSRHHIRSQH